jgi:hypothetical protein
MSNERYYNRLEFIIRNDNELSTIFRRICKYYNAHGKIQDKFSFSNISINSKRQLRYAFSSESVKTNGVDLKLFFKSLNFNTARKEEWLNHIYEFTGIEKKSIYIEEQERKKELKAVWKRLCIQFPNLVNIVDYIRNEQILDKESEQNVNDALKIIDYLYSNSQIIDFSKLGAAVLGNSKIIRKNEPLYRLVFRLLLSEVDSFAQRQYIENPNILYERYNIISNPTAIKVTLFAPLVYYKNGIQYDFVKKLWEVGESATLSLDNLNGIEELQLEGDLKIVTCENESPFNSMIRNKKDYSVIFTSGYPNSAVKKVLILLKDKCEYIHHWGDSDLDGLYIASIIDKIIPVKLWRCDLAALKSHRKKLRKIDDQHILYKMEKFLIKNQSFPFKNELLFTMKNGWLEQESIRSVRV